MRDFMPCKGCDEPEACEIEGRCLEPAQEPVAWYWQHVMQESKGVIEAGFSGTRVEPTDDAMWNGKVATVVTELHAGRKLLPPKFAAAVGQPTEIPPAGVGGRGVKVSRVGPDGWLQMIENLLEFALSEDDPAKMRKGLQQAYAAVMAARSHGVTVPGHQTFCTHESST